MILLVNAVSPDKNKDIPSDVKVIAATELDQEINGFYERVILRDVIDKVKYNYRTRIITEAIKKTKIDGYVEINGMDILHHARLTHQFMASEYSNILGSVVSTDSLKDIISTIKSLGVDIINVHYDATKGYNIVGRRKEQ